MKQPEWLDNSELDESIAALDAIKPDPDRAKVEDAINRALYWLDAVNSKPVSSEQMLCRAEGLTAAIQHLGYTIARQAYNSGRRHVEIKR
jgi:uncharacterized protein (DUF2344 family)